MELNSFYFIPTFFLLYLILLIAEGVKHHFSSPVFTRVQVVLLLAFSYFFIYAADWRFGICIAVATSAAYGLGISIERDFKRKRAYLTLGIVFLTLMLGYFKYTNFFLSSLAALFHKEPPCLQILYPIGISFYVFSAISYLMDVYREKYSAEKNFLNFSLYIAFFPKLTAGPIIRGSEFLPQVRNYAGLRAGNFSTGVQIFVLGLFKKIVLADHLSVFVNDVFYAPSAYTTATVLLAILSYSLQIYLDFSGYSDMAIGIARILGFHFRPNFNLPYIAAGIGDFWKRWHISLSSWFMEYLYFPLGGSRRGKLRCYINLMLVMLISGLWHGAGFTFLIWGALHGLCSCLEHCIKSRGIKIPKWFEIPVTFLLISLLWVFFRASSLHNALEVLKAAFTLHSGISQMYTWTFLALGLTLISTYFAYLHSKKDNMKNKDGSLSVNGFYPLLDLTKISGLTVFFIICGLILIMGYFGNTVFIYGNF